MTLDKEEHRQLLLELIDKAHFPGSARRVVMELAEAIETADCPKPAKPRNEGADS